MPGTRRPIYQERTPWPGWVWVVLWGTLALSAMAVVALEEAEPLEERLAIAVGLLALGVSIQWALGGLTVRLYQNEMVVGLGHISLIRKTIAYDEIVRMEVVHYSPLRDFGGWGYRYRGKRRAWSARGDEAVVLHTADGLEVYIGSDRPGRLRERIRAVGGTRIGSRRAAS